MKFSQFLAPAGAAPIRPGARQLQQHRLPYGMSVKDQPKQLSRISRNTVRHQPEPKRQASAEVIHPTLCPH